MKKLVVAVFALAMLFKASAQETPYTNNMDYVIGDVKQAFIQNKITTEEQAKNLIRGMKILGVNGIRIPIFAEGLTPNKVMFDYFFDLAVAEGFPIFANPAQHSGGQRIANGVLEETGESPLNRPEATAELIKQIKAFSAAYACKWINPFNEDGAPGGAWSAEQMNTIYASLKGNLNGAELIGPCVWGIPGGLKVLQQTEVLKHVTVSTTHNLGFNHDKWEDFIAESEKYDLPVWDSEVNHNDAKDNGTRLEKAIENGVDGLVMYNIWNTISLADGSINNAAKNMMALYMKNIPELTPYYRVGTGNWKSATALVVEDGSSIGFSPQPSDGTWEWYGPDGFAATTREITLTDFSEAKAGKYFGTYTSPDGNVNTLVMTLGRVCDNSPSITPYYRVNGGAWATGLALSLEKGSNIDFGPQPTSGTWFWTGPAGFAQDGRSVSISNLSVYQSGDYEASVINSAGCGATATYQVAVTGTAFFTPDPTASYYIDCPALGRRLAADGESETPFTVDMSEVGDNVAWKFVPQGNGHWHIERAAGGSKPRLLGTATEKASMQASSATGEQSYFEFIDGYSGGTYLITLPDVLNNYSRLQLDANNELKMTGLSNYSSMESFTFTEVPVGVYLEAEDYSQTTGTETETTTDEGGGQQVNWITAGAFTDYAVQIPQEKTYTVKLRLSNWPASGALRLWVDDAVVATVDLASINAETDWYTAYVDVALEAGQHNLRIESEATGWSINWLNIGQQEEDPNKPLAVLPAATQTALRFPTLLHAGVPQFKPLQAVPNPSEYRLHVYNLQGTLVFSTGDTQEAWTPATAAKGMFLYRVKYQNAQGVLQLENGKVVLQ